MPKKQLIDPRKRRVVLSMDAALRGDNEIMKDLLINASSLIAAIVDRQNTPGLHGHKKNYDVCKALAKMRIVIDQASNVWSADNIATFERSIIREMETVIRERRDSERRQRIKLRTCDIIGHNSDRYGFCIRCGEILN